MSAVTLVVLTALATGAAHPSASGENLSAAGPPTAGPGEVVDSEVIPLAASVPSGAGQFPATAIRVHYRTTSATGRPITNSGTVFVPTAPWRGYGVRPLVSLAVGTHGLGPQCRTSELVQSLHYRPPRDLAFENELPYIYALVLQGITTVVADYPPDSYLNPRAEGPVVIDAARAAPRVPGASVAPDSPVAFWGYSQGGQASAAAAEQVRSYAPELDVKGAFVGAPPQDMFEELRTLDGSALVGVDGYFLDSLAATYPETAKPIERSLNAAGRRLMMRTANQCGFETMLEYGNRRSAEFTRDGRPVAQVLASDPLTATVIDEMALGRTAPATPVLLAIGDDDELVSPAGVRRLSRQWCAAGATVELMDMPSSPAPAPFAGHGANEVRSAAGQGFRWLVDRFDGRPAPSNCR